MTPELLLRHPKSEQLGELEATLHGQELHRDALDTEIYDQYAQASPSGQRAIDAFYQAVDDIRQTDEPDYVAITEVLEAAPNIPKDIRASFEEYTRVSSEIQTTYSELNQFVPEIAEQVVNECKTMESTIDYERLLRGTNDDARLASKIIAIRMILEESGTELTYSDVMDARREITASYQYIEIAGVVNQEPHDSITTDCNPDDIADVMSHMQYLHSIHHRYKAPSDTLTNDLQMMIRAGSKVLPAETPPQTIAEIHTVYNGIVYNEQFATAARAYMIEIIEAMDPETYHMYDGSDMHTTLIQEAVKINAADCLQDVKISGDLGSLPFEYSKEQIIADFQYLLPALAFKNVEEIEFRPFTDDEKGRDLTLGLHKLTGGRSTIIISTLKITDYYNVSKSSISNTSDNAEAIAASLAKADMINTMVHEFAHSLHYQLPVASLIAWDKARDSDPKTYVTSYVESCFRRNIPNRYVEDFSESLALFVRSPRELQHVSPKRYAAMQDLYKTFMPDYESR